MGNELWGGKEEEHKGGVVFRINGEEMGPNANEEQIRHFIHALDLNMKRDLLQFLKNTHGPRFKLWVKLLSEEIQRTDTENMFPITRDEATNILIKIMVAYGKLPEYEKKILWELFKSKEMQTTLRRLDLNMVKVIALNKAVSDVDSADGAVELLKLATKHEEDRKEVMFSGIDFILKNRIGNPEAGFRLLKLVKKDTGLTENEKQRLSEFLDMLDPDFLSVKVREILNTEIKRLMVKRLLHATSDLGWVPKNKKVREVFERHKLTGKK